VPRARAAGACYSDRVGRLDNIIARNRRPNRLHERVIVSMVMGLIVLVIIALAVFTDLGLPPDADDARARPSEPGGPGRQAGSGAHGTPGARAADRGKRVDGVLLRVPPAKPARH
jgi:hypothetical protein